MDLETLKDYFEAIGQELNIGDRERFKLYKAMLKHKYILDAKIGEDINAVIKIARTKAGP